MKKVNDSAEEFNSLQCIWMSSGLIKYKLCDCGFNCDNCLFDKVMRNMKSEIEEFIKNPAKINTGSNPVTAAIEKIKTTLYSKNLIYLKNNLVLKRLFRDIYYLGLSPIAYLLLDQVSGYNYCRDNKDKTVGEPVIQFTGDWGSIIVPSPIHFFCLGRLKPELNDLQLNSWFSMILADEDEVFGAVITEREFEKLKNETIEIINNSVQIFPNVGVTLNDGGERVRYLYQAIGQLNYYTIFKKLFNL